MKHAAIRLTGNMQKKYRRLIRTLIALVLLAFSGTSGAVEIPTGNDSLMVRWDNTLRYTVAQRLDGQNRAIVGNLNTDDGDRNFSSGIVSNRFDLLSEADLVYKKKYGLRVSGAAWYDERYANEKMQNRNVATSNYLVGSGTPSVGLNSYNTNNFSGPNGELLDAFAFVNSEIGGMPLNVKIGRHTIYWGESLGVGGLMHSVAYAQMPLDQAKALAMPGAEVKELFRPLNSISFQFQPTSRLSIAGQYCLQWESNKFAEAGTYLGASDVQVGGDQGSLITGFAPGIGYLRVLKGADIEPNGMRDWGVALRWAPELLGGDLGSYYRNFSDKSPQVLLQNGLSGSTVSNQSLVDLSRGIIGRYYLAYAQDITLYGISLSKDLLGISVGAELSYRQNMPLVSEIVLIPPSADTPSAGETGGARGNTWHALINFVGSMGRNPLFHAATWSMEYVGNHLDSVTQGAAVYKGRDGYSGIDKPTRNFVGGALNVNPTWFQTFSGVDLSLPLSISSGLIGNSCVAGGGNKNGGSWGVGVGADIFMKYKMDIRYVDFFGDYTTDPATGALKSSNGGSALLSDRGFISLTLKTTF
jgi:Protein of unknown function (DUF1302)